jgi:cytosine/adenosine deaminase-related metal-dependent hydrolase
VVESRTLTARWIFPVAGPPLERGTVTIRGDKIEAVEPRGTRTPDEVLGNVAIIPGLVNAHTHLDLSGARGLIPPTAPDHFTDWLRGVIAYRRTRTQEQVQADIREGLAECLRCGTTLIGDITAEGASWEALAAAPMRAVVYGEMIGLRPARAQESVESLAISLKSREDSLLCRKGYSPHAPYSANRTLIRIAAQSHRPAAIHLAEAPAETQLLDDGTGPFRDFLEQINAWDADQLADSHGDVVSRLYGSKPVLLVHANYLSPAVRLSANQSIVYCPRTHAAFGHPPHPFREFLARGVRVCLGTDSLASNPDLDILAEARFVRSRYPVFPGDLLLRMITLSGAEALGWADECGSLEVGKSADLVAVPLADRDDADPYDLLLAEDAGPRRTMFRGHWSV